MAKISQTEFIKKFSGLAMNDRELLEIATKLKDPHGAMVAQETLRALEFFDQYLKKIDFKRY